MFRFRYLLGTCRTVLGAQFRYSSNLQACPSSNLKVVEGTLTNRLLYYLFDYLPIQALHNDEITSLLKHKTLKDLKHYNSQTLIAVFNSLIDQHNNERNTNIASMMQILEIDCCRRLNDLTNAEILSYLCLFMKFSPITIINTKYYDLAIKKLLNSSDLSHNELIQLLFFIGLQKKNSNSTKMVRKCLKLFNSELINSLTIEELCIICNTTYKTSTRITNKLFLDNILKCLNENLNIFNDPAILITLLKTIRYHRFQNEDLLATIHCTMFFNKVLCNYSFPALCHVLAVYSDYLYYDEKVLEIFFSRCIELLRDSNYTSKSTYFLQQPRLKDIQRLLWCLSNLNFKVINNCDIENVILPQVLVRIKSCNSTEDAISLMDICLYLWMLNYRPSGLIQHCFSEDNLHLLSGYPSKSKAQLNLLISCIFFEDRDLYNKLNLGLVKKDYNINPQLKKRPLLKEILTHLQNITKEHEINKFEICCQVPGLNILGITGYRNGIYKAVNIELLDEYTVLKNTENMPTGLMQLKLRLLETVDEALIVIDSNEIDSNSDIKEILLDELNLVC